MVSTAISVLAATGCAAHARGTRRSTGVPVIEFRQADVVEIRMRLSIASRCKRPLPTSPVRSVDAERAGCRLRPYRGSLPLIFQSRELTWLDASVRLDPNGRVRLRYSELDAKVRRAGFQAGLHTFEALGLGNESSVGRIDLRALLHARADQHFLWISRGWGAPALFAPFHAGHPEHGNAERLAVDARVARQRRDLAAVKDAQLGAEEFLRRHPWSPFRFVLDKRLRTLEPSEK